MKLNEMNEIEGITIESVVIVIDYLYEIISGMNSRDINTAGIDRLLLISRIRGILYYITI